MLSDIVYAVAVKTVRELNLRGIKVSASDEHRAKAKPRQLCVLKDALFQVTLFGKGGDYEVERMAKELAIKLARPFDIVSFSMEVPSGVDEGYQCCVDGLYLRGVADYHIEMDETVMRLDCVVKWNEE